MTEEKKDQWTTYMALTTIIVAVCATFSTFKGGGYSTRSLMCQANASDQWAFFQAKSTKGYLFEMQNELFQLQLQTLNSKEVVTKYEEKISSYKEKIKKYELEKEEIKQKAEKFEKERDLCKQHSSQFGIAVIFLQLSILLSSIAALIKKKYIWQFSLLVGIIGILFFLNGFFLIV